MMKKLLLGGIVGAAVLPVALVAPASAKSPVKVTCSVKTTCVKAKFDSTGALTELDWKGKATATGTTQIDVYIGACAGSPYQSSAPVPTKAGKTVKINSVVSPPQVVPVGTLLCASFSGSGAPAGTINLQF